MTQQLHKNDILYYARIMPTLGLYDVYELKIRTIDEENRWFCGMEKRTKIAYLFSYDNIARRFSLIEKKLLKQLNKLKRIKSQLAAKHCTKNIRR